MGEVLEVGEAFGRWWTSLVLVVGVATLLSFLYCRLVLSLVDNVVRADGKETLRTYIEVSLHTYKYKLIYI